MSAENSGLRDLTGPLMHRLTGRYNASIDLDVMETDAGMVEGSFMEVFNNKTVAFADYKRCIKRGIDNQDFGGPAHYGSIKHQSFHAQSEVKQPVPFFVYLTYLNEDWTDKMVHVLTGNLCAKQLFQHHHNFGGYVEGTWMTIKGFAHFQHILRGIKVDWNQPVGNNNIKSMLKCCPSFPVMENMLLKDLPHIHTIYPLPHPDFLHFVNQLRGDK